MTGSDKRLPTWQVIPIVLAILLPAVDMGDRLWGSASASALTTYQVAQLTQALHEINDRLNALGAKIDNTPKQAALDYLSRRQDADEQKINTLADTTGRLDERVTSIERGLPYRGVH